MANDTNNPEPKENVKALAERIVNYETREKGTMGELFAFEARDGFWSKLVKTISAAASAIVSSSVTFTAIASVTAGPAGLVAAGLAAAAIGLVSGAITRAVNKSVFSDLHDSHKSDLTKFGHYMGIVVAAVAAGTAVNSMLPGLGTLAAASVNQLSQNVVNPLVEIATSKGIASALGDQQLRNESAEARQIAQKTIESGQSVEQLLGQKKTADRTQAQAVQEAPEQAAAKGRSFTKMVEQQRANPQKLSIT